MMPEKRVRIAGVTNGNYSASYSYLANSPLVEQIVFKDTGTTRMTTTKSYDSLNRLTAISSPAGVAPISSLAYLYNDANQRVRATLARAPIGSAGPPE